MRPAIRIFIAVALYRLLNALSIVTFFQPDEYYQALEPAHKLVYGYGYITWEWYEGLRSSLHPWIYALAYKGVGQLLPNHEDWVVYLAPKLVGALVAALGETYLYKFALAYTGSVQVATFALSASLLSAWNWFFITRAFSNNLEMVLTVMGLSYWPWNRPSGCIVKSCIFGFLSCIVRPTNALLWGFLGGSYMLSNITDPAKLISVGSTLVTFFGVICAATALPDLLFYGEPTLPLYNFLEFNVLRNLSIFYGSAPWHFYAFQALPLLLMGYLPLWGMAMWRHRKSLLVNASVFVIAGFSCIAHKEFRFIYPLYPIFMVLTAQAARTVIRRRYAKAAAITVAILHSVLAIFFTRINESGEIGVMGMLKNDPQVTSIGCLTPCHSFPWHSTLHREDLVANSWMLTCEPPLHLANGNVESIEAYRDESDRFFDDPVGFLEKTLGTSERPWPSHLVIFSPIEKEVSDFLQNTSYKVCARVFNSYFHWDPRRWGDIIVYCNVDENQ